MPLSGISHVVWMEGTPPANRRPSRPPPPALCSAAPGPEEAPLVGSSCSTVTPGDNKACCETKVAENTEDAWCLTEYPEVRREQPRRVLFCGSPR